MARRLFTIGRSILFLLLPISCHSQLGQQNEKKAQAIRVGMRPNEVIQVMGLPKNDTTPFPFVYEYESDNVDYFDLEIFFDSTKRVAKVVIPERD